MTKMEKACREVTELCVFLCVQRQ